MIYLRLIILFISFCQNYFVYEKVILSPELNELSGLEIFNNQLISHNDSGSQSIIYVSDKETLNFKEVRLENLTNVDWEDICSDSKNLYIGDFGNNYQNRKDLKIYILNSEYKTTDSISISYEHQVNFERNHKNRFDAEALISFGDDLILFSKNRINYESYIYKIPKKTKEVSLKETNKIRFRGLITGADYNEEMNLLALVGYSNDQEFQYLYLIPDFRIDFNEGDVFTHVLPFYNSQIEGVKIISNNLLLLSSEDENKKEPFILKVNIPNGLINQSGKFNPK